MISSVERGHYPSMSPVQLKNALTADQNYIRSFLYAVVTANHISPNRAKADALPANRSADLVASTGFSRHSEGGFWTSALRLSQRKNQTCSLSDCGLLTEATLKHSRPS